MTVPATDVTYSVEMSSDITNPASWSSSGTTVESNTSTSLVVRDSSAIGSPPRRFMRLKVTSP